MDPITVNFAHILLSLKDSESSSSEEEGFQEEKFLENDHIDCEDYSVISNGFQKGSYVDMKQAKKKMKIAAEHQSASPPEEGFSSRSSSKHLSEDVFTATQILHQVKCAVECFPVFGSEKERLMVHKKHHSSPVTSDSAPAKPTTTCNRGNYRCGRCGQLKSNHVCGGGEKVVLFNAQTQTQATPLTGEGWTERNKHNVFDWLEKVHGKERVLTVRAPRPSPPSSITTSSATTATTATTAV